jgi:hypothetical protein
MSETSVLMHHMAFFSPVREKGSATNPPLSPEPSDKETKEEERRKEKGKERPRNPEHQTATTD